MSRLFKDYQNLSDIIAEATKPASGNRGSTPKYPKPKNSKSKMPKAKVPDSLMCAKPTYSRFKQPCRLNHQKRVHIEQPKILECCLLTELIS